MSVLSLEIKTPVGTSIYTLGRTPVQNNWATNWYGIVDDIEVHDSMDNSKEYTITILFMDLRSIVITAYKNQAMIVRAKDSDDAEKFKLEQYKFGRLELEELENGIKKNEEDNGNKNMIPVIV